jgi:hypothetical protein
LTVETERLKRNLMLCSCQIIKHFDYFLDVFFERAAGVWTKCEEVSFIGEPVSRRQNGRGRQPMANHDCANAQVVAKPRQPDA